MYPNVGDITPTTGWSPGLKKEEEESRVSAFIFLLFLIVGAMLTADSCPYCHDVPDGLHPQMWSKETLLPQ